MGSLYLNKLTPELREDLVSRLLESQRGVCFICEGTLDPVLHAETIDIDHVEPLTGGGKDDPSNFAATHSSCNRSKQAAHLEVARVLRRFERIRESSDSARGPNLSDVLSASGGSIHDMPIDVSLEHVRFSFPDIDENEIQQAQLLTDPLSGNRYFFANLPIEYLHHDDRINPRGIGANLSKLVAEFHRKRPQLHIALCWVATGSSGRQKLQIFDGQHKTAAQVLLGVRRLPVRIFVDPDLDVLLTTNTNAGTTLRQVAFDKSVQRHLGNSLFWDRVDEYRKDRGLAQDDLSFSEKDLVQHFRGESREMKRYVLDSVRDGITHHPDNPLRAYIDLGGRKNERPLSYSTVEKTFYSFFICSDVLETNLDYRLDEGKNPRELEKSQIVRLMEIVATEILVPDFDPEIGTYRIEHRVQRGDDLPDGHIRAFRMMKEEVLYAWLSYVRQIVNAYFNLLGQPVREDRLFQYAFPEPLWDRVASYIVSLAKMPVWVNHELSRTVFGGKQRYEFWQGIFETGRSLEGQHVLAEGLNLMEMIRTDTPIT